MKQQQNTQKYYYEQGFFESETEFTNRIVASYNPFLSKCTISAVSWNYELDTKRIMTIDNPGILIYISGLEIKGKVTSGKCLKFSATIYSKTNMIIAEGIRSFSLSDITEATNTNLVAVDENGTSFGTSLPIIGMYASRIDIYQSVSIIVKMNTTVLKVIHGKLSDMIFSDTGYTRDNQGFYYIKN